ncbi:MAG TPA: ACP S-malonyltransferase [bacterium]|nr:ACP S-malonyltransferase [bacterium]
MSPSRAGRTVPCAAVFPGQGAQYAGMGRELAERFPEAREVFRRASDAAGLDLYRLCVEGPDDALRQTVNTQPAILTASLACLATVPLDPSCAAGLSLGEYTALVCAGAVSLEDAVRLVRLRGRYMQEAGEGLDTMMAAVVGLEASRVRAVCDAHAHLGVVEPSNFNSPGQVVVGGEAAAVRAVLDAARAAGARRAIPLAVSAPFHTRLMAPAAARLAADLERLPLRDARIPVIANVSAAPVRTADEIRRALLAQVDSPVRWEESVRAMAADGIGLFVEVGPGTTVSGMIRRTAEGAVTCHVEDVASRDETLALLAAAAAPNREEGARTAPRPGDGPDREGARR